MKTRKIWKVLAGVVVLLAGAASVHAADDRMNVLFIISDDMRTELGCYASTLAKTPNIDRLAESGVRFNNAYCQFPLCNPSRASMLTGRHPGTTGVLGNRTWFGDKHPEFVSLPRHFKEHGYTSIRVGKIFHGGIDDTEAWSVNGQVRRLAGVPAEARAKQRREEEPDERVDTRNPPGDAKRPKLTKNQRSDRWVVLDGMGEGHGDYNSTERAIGYLREFKDKPFFMGCGFMKPHTPLEAPKKFFDMWDAGKIPLPPDFAPRPTVPPGFPAGCIRPQNADLFIGRDATPDEARQMIRAYLASSAWMDWNVGRVLGELEALGLREKTIVVFWGDHGFQLGEKGKWSKAGSLWEQGTRTPFIIHDPRAKANGKASTRVVQLVDLYPTLVELCGLPRPDGLEGRSLAPLLEEPAAAWDHPAYSVWSEDGKFFSGVMVRVERWRYAEFFGRGAGRMLLDTTADPHEMTNLAEKPEHTATVERLSAMVKAYAAGHLPPADLR